MAMMEMASAMTSVSPRRDWNVMRSLPCSCLMSFDIPQRRNIPADVARSVIHTSAGDVRFDTVFPNSHLSPSPLSTDRICIVGNTLLTIHDPVMSSISAAMRVTVV